MDYSVYKLLHYLGMAMLLVAIGGVCVHAADNKDKASSSLRKLIISMHGAGTLVILFAGFGMLAKLGSQTGGFPAWLWPKLAIWVILAASIGLPYRDRRLSIAISIGAPILVLLAAYFAVYKPI